MTRDIDQVLHDRGICTRIYGNDIQTSMNRSLTKEEGVMYINVWREMNVPKHNLRFPTMTKWSVTSGVEHVYLNFMVDELIDRVWKSQYDPITAVAEYYYEMDEILSMSDNDHHITHYFAGYMERESYDVLNYLREKEKEMNSVWA